MNLPNKLTIFRIILVPVTVLVKIFPYAQFGIDLGYYQIGSISLPVVNVIVLVLFCVAAFTDFLDGHIARKNNLITSFGKFADPIADKMLTTSLFVLLAVDGVLPVMALLVFLWRDIIIDGLRMVASNKGVVVAAGMLGKAKTVAQMFAIIFLLLENLPFELVGIPFTDFLIWLAVFLSIASGVVYFNQMKEYIFESM